MSDTADFALAQANAMGRWSFAFTPTGPIANNQIISLFTLQGLDAWFSRRWTVHLNHFRYTGGGALNPNISADNQVFSEGRMRVKIDYGVDGGEESVLVDWPCQGNTFQLHAGSFRIGLTQPPSGTLAAPFPLLMGFVAPTADSSRAPSPQAPCLTTELQNFAPLSSTSMPRPARAIAYRVFTTGLGGPLSLSESSHIIANIVKFDGPMNNGVPADPMYLWSNQAAWIPLETTAQFVNITNQSAVTGTLASVQWLLDLG